MWNTVTGGSPISAREGSEGLTTSAGRTVAALAVLACVLLLAALPAAVATGLADGVVQRLAGWLGWLALVLVTAKFAAALFGLARRFLERPLFRSVAAAID